jgi:hypothetical protein
MEVGAQQSQLLVAHPDSHDLNAFLATLLRAPEQQFSAPALEPAPSVRKPATAACRVAGCGKEVVGARVHARPPAASPASCAHLARCGFAALSALHGAALHCTALCCLPR